MNRIGWILAVLLIVFLILMRVQLQDADKFYPDFRSTSKAPYGSKAVVEWLRYQHNRTVTVSTGTLDQLSRKTTGPVILLLATDHLELDDASLDAMFTLLDRGSTIILSAITFADTILDACEIDDSYIYTGAFPLFDARYPSRILTEHSSAPGFRYTFSEKRVTTYDSVGRSYEYQPLEAGWRAIINKVYPEGSTVAARKTYGKGQLLLCSAPQLFTNYGLLYDELWHSSMAVLSYMPEGVVYWDEHYKPMQASEQLAPLSYLKSHKGLMLAYLILLGGLGMYLIVAGKRRQRAIPSKPPIVNTTLDFLDSITSLYWLRKDHAAILSRIAAQFRKHVTRKLRLPVDGDPNHIAKMVSASSGVAPDVVLRLVTLAQRSVHNKVSDAELKSAHADIHTFFSATSI